MLMSRALYKLQIGELVERVMEPVTICVLHTTDMSKFVGLSSFNNSASSCVVLHTLHNQVFAIVEDLP